MATQGPHKRAGKGTAKKAAQASQAGSPRQTGHETAGRKPAGQKPRGSRPRGHEAEVEIPVQLRVGGAFLAVTVALLLLGLINLLTNGVATPFVWTPAQVLLVVAAAIVGAFATMNRSQKASRVQVGALIVGIILIGASRFLPATTLYAQPVYWLFVYAAAALVCALLLRRSVMPH